MKKDHCLLHRELQKNCLQETERKQNYHGTGEQTNAEVQQRTPPYEVIRSHQSGTSVSSKDKEEIPDEDLAANEGLQTKRVKTPPEESEEDTQRRVQEWKDAADADRKLAESWKQPEITEEGQRRAEETFKR